MRIHSDHTESYIHGLVASISKDPASLEQWHCLHLHPLQEEQVNLAAIHQLKHEYKEADCDVVICPDKDLLLISRDVEANILNRCAVAFTSGPAEVVSYDLFRDWRQARVMLSQKITGEVPSTFVPEILPAFGEISALREAFAEAKNVRKSRQPLHVMVVEDDPLTRRMVIGAFKNNYALMTAENAQEAIINYLVHAPDIVFLDIGLPDASGFDVLHQIMEVDPDAYVVMFSGNSYLDNVTTALSSGASGFVAKPFKKEKMRRYIQDSELHHRKLGEGTHA